MGSNPLMHVPVVIWSLFDMLPQKWQISRTMELELWLRRGEADRIEDNNWEKHGEI